MSTTASPPTSVDDLSPAETWDLWLEDLPASDPFRLNIEKAIGHLDGECLDPDTLEGMAHHELATNPRGPVAIACYRAANWHPAVVAVMMAELRPYDAQAQDAAKTARRFKMGRAAASPEVREAFFITHQHVRSFAIPSRTPRMARIVSRRPHTTGRARGHHMARSICGGSGDDDGSGGEGDGPDASSPVTPQTPLPASPAPAVASDPHTRERKRLFAEYCLCCGKPLCDAVSVALAVGPSCRKRLGITADVGKRLAANEQVALLVEAAERSEAREVLRLVAVIRQLDPAYEKLAERIEARWLKAVAPFLVLESTGRPSTHLAIRTPYSLDFVARCRESGFWWLPKPIRAWQFPKDKLPVVLRTVGDLYNYPTVLSTDLKRYETDSGDYTV